MLNKLCRINLDVHSLTDTSTYIYINDKSVTFKSWVMSQVTPKFAHLRTHNSATIYTGWNSTLIIHTPWTYWGWYLWYVKGLDCTLSKSAKEICPETWYKCLPVALVLQSTVVYQGFQMGQQARFGRAPSQSSVQHLNHNTTGKPPLTDVTISSYCNIGAITRPVHQPLYAGLRIIYLLACVCYLNGIING